MIFSLGPSSSPHVFNDLLSEINYLESHLSRWHCLPADSLNSASSLPSQCDAILSRHGISPSSIRVFEFFSHLLRGDCFQSQSATCVALASHFNHNVQHFLGKLYDFLVSSVLSFAFLREIAGLPHHLLKEFTSPSDLRFFIDYFRDDR